MENLFITNSVFVTRSTSGFSPYYSSSSKSTSEQTGYLSFIIKNNVFCNTTSLTTATARLFLLNPYDGTGTKTVLTMPNIVFEFNGNTVYGWPSRIIGVSQPGRVSESNNIFEASLTATTYAMHINANGTQKNYNSFCVNNFARSTSAFAWTLSSTGNVTSDNNITGVSGDPGDPFLGTKDTSIGYLPVNTSVVTNGAGATYSTKLWRTWE